ncbi:MAG: hypothetical protein IJK97_06805, partial [Thermoguttaceae bacterium]|nr:hypothetical protein [Thermoguttaceae bacterium]
GLNSDFLLLAGTGAFFLGHLKPPKNYMVCVDVKFVCSENKCKKRVNDKMTLWSFPASQTIPSIKLRGSASPREAKRKVHPETENVFKPQRTQRAQRVFFLLRSTRGTLQTLFYYPLCVLCVPCGLKEKRGRGFIFSHSTRA